MTEDPNRLVTVHAGPAWDVELVAQMLQEEGIDCFLPDLITKTVDPFITGPNPLESRLQVRAADLDAARVVVEEAREARARAAAAAEAPDASGEPADEIEWLATRTRWAALIGIGLPFALVYGWLYLRASRAEGRRSRYHGLTVAAFALSMLALVSLVAWILLAFVLVPTVLG